MTAPLADLPAAARKLAPWLALAVTVAVGTWRGLGAGLLCLAAFSLLYGIGLLWASVQSLTGEAPLTLDEALGYAAPSAEEEKKRAVLRALKDLEYERSVGKISEEDYADLTARYRAEAKVLLRALEHEQGPSLERAEKLLEKRLAKTNLDAAPPSAAPGNDDEADSDEADSDEADSDEADDADADNDEAGDADNDDADNDDADNDDASERVQCTSCDTSNEPDAAFCKKCGHALSEDDEDDA